MAKPDQIKGGRGVAGRRSIDGPRCLGDVAVNAELRVRADTRLSTAWTLFLDRDLQSVTVVDEQERPVGTLSRRDLADAVLDEAPTVPGANMELLSPQSEPLDSRPVRGWRNDEAAVEEVMRSSVNTLPASASLEDAAAVFEVAVLSEVVVVDDGGRMIGLVAAEDLVPYLPPEGAPGRRWRAGGAAAHRR